MSYDYKVASADVLNAADEVVYSGASFTAALNWAVNHASTTTYVPSGTYALAADITLAEGATIYGDGATMTILTAPSLCYLLISNVSSVSVSDVGLTGSVQILITVSASGSEGTILIEDVSADGVSSIPEACFEVYLGNDATLDGVTFHRCNVTNSGTYGFLMTGSGYDKGGLIKNLTFDTCTATGCGLATRYNDWVAGFGVCEATNVENVILTSCESSYSWESGFSMEGSPSQVGVQYISCIASHNGQKPNALYGYGYIFSTSKIGLAGINFTDCGGIDNSGGLSPLLQGVLA
jgi:hypothetical protein